MHSRHLPCFQGSYVFLGARGSDTASVKSTGLQVPQQTGSCQQAQHAEQQASSPQHASTSRSSSFLSRWRWSAPTAPADSSPSTVNGDTSSRAEASSSSRDRAGSSSNGSAPGSSALSSEASRPVAAAATAFELVEPQAPLTESLMQEPFVLVRQRPPWSGFFCFLG